MLKASRIAVVTAITSQKDTLIESYKNKGGARFIAFCDRKFESKIWEYAPAYNKFSSARRNARIHKILLHQFVDADYSIWIDGNIVMNVSPSLVVRDWLKDADIAAFRHPERNCVYQEAAICQTLNKEPLDNPDIQEQSNHIKLPLHNGLLETGVVIRRHNQATETFNNYWWSELCRYSTRDQLSFMYCINKLNMRVNAIEPLYPREGLVGNRWGHPYFTYRLHTR